MNELYDSDIVVASSSLIEVYAYGCDFTEGLNEAVDSVVVRLPVFGSIEVVAVDALDDNLDYLLLYEIKHIFGNCVGVNP